MNRKLVTLSPGAIARVGASSVLALDEGSIGGSISMLATAPAEQEASKSPVGRVEISGPLAQKAVDGLCAFVDGYDAVATRFERALEASDAVFLVIDSPGGDVAGLESGVERMRAARAKHPGKVVHAYIDETAASAAYWIVSSIADHITVPAAGRVGSIGCIGMVADSTAALEKQGLKLTVIREPAGKAEAHPAAPITDLAAERLKESVSDAASRFYAAVSSARNLDVKAIRNLNGAMLRGQAAVDAGLADSVGSMDSAAARLGSLAKEARAKREREKNMGLHAIAAQLVGLSADAPVEVVEAAVAKTAADILASSGAEKLTDVAAKVDAFKVELRAQTAKAVELEGIKAELALAAKTKADDLLASTIDKAVENGKIAPAEREETAALAAQHGQTWLDALVARLPERVSGSAANIQAAGSGAAGAPVSVDPELATLLRLTGQSAESYQKAEAERFGRGL